MQVLSGSPDTTRHTLRYKRKMVLWGVDQEVGYCMMTFVIRNGLKALKLGEGVYLGYVSSLARQWGLTHQQQSQVGVQVGMGHHAWHACCDV